jgi:hypothetical protein
MTGLDCLDSSLTSPSVTNIYPVLAQADNKAVRLLVIAVVVLHAALAFTLKILFYSYV